MTLISLGGVGLVVTLLNRNMRGVTTAPCFLIDNRQQTTDNSLLIDNCFLT